MMQDDLSASGSNPEKTPSKDVSPARAGYNVVSDTLTGVNVRKSDNLLQAKVVFVSMLLVAALGAALAALNVEWELPWYGGALIGAFVGLVIGIFASGIFLMIYRAIRHIQGKHD